MAFNDACTGVHQIRHVVRVALDLAAPIRPIIFAGDSVKIPGNI